MSKGLVNVSCPPTMPSRGDFQDLTVMKEGVDGKVAQLLGV